MVVAVAGAWAAAGAAPAVTARAAQMTIASERLDMVVLSRRGLGCHRFHTLGEEDQFSLHT